MKRIHLKIAVLISLMMMVVISACVKGDFDEPPLNVPKFVLPAGASLKTIAELKAMYPTLPLLDSIEENIYIRGRVVANDESGNLYKKLVIQDETAGIELELDQTSLYTVYHIGQMIYVKCQGMYIGDYHGYVQLGALYQGSIGRLASVFVKDHLKLDSLPAPALAPAPKTLQIQAISNADNSTLVKFTDVKFVESGQPYATTTATTNRTLMDNSGKLLTVRTSNYALFASALLPGGKGTVVGIMGVYDGTYQLTLRDTSDVTGFTPVGPGPSGDYVYPDAVVAPLASLNENFASVVTNTDISLPNWTVKASKGTRNWQGKVYAGPPSEEYAQATSYGSTNPDAENMMWLVTPAVTYNSNLTLTFKTASTYWTHDGIAVYILTGYTGGTTGTWTKIEGLNLANQASSTTGSSNWITGTKAISSIVPGGYSGTIYIGFRYTGSKHANQTTTYRLDDVSIQ